MAEARDFVVYHLMPTIRELMKDEMYLSCFGSNFDPVSRAQEQVMRHYKEMPVWDVVDKREGVWFKVAARVKSKTLSEGEGSNLAQARRNAAEKVLDMLTPKHQMHK